MANGVNGVLCKLYKGSYSSKVEIVGQGDATITHGGAPIEITNKSTGLFRTNLSNSTSTKSLDIALDFHFSDDATIAELTAAAFAGTDETYTFDLINYYVEGTFTPVLNTTTAAKDTAVTQSFTFMSNGEWTEVTP